MNNKELEDEIKLLIESKREGDYWDFKVEHHKNKADLLHDIICMANSKADRDCYIIYGIEDDNYNVIGVENHEKRRNQQNIIDFLKDKKFVGGVRPVIELRSIQIDKHIVDILIIKNSYDVPYYLTAQYSDGAKNIVYANNIYSRVGDTNTPKKSAADINNVEYLWRKRFLLNRPPIIQIKNKLKNKKEWQENDGTYYNIYNPEFTIITEYDHDLERPEYYAYVMQNESVMYKNINIAAFGTKLETYQGVVLDSGRYSIIVPEREYLSFGEYRGDYDYHFRYYIKDSMQNILSEFFYDCDDGEERNARRRLEEIIITFNSENEKADFINYLEINNQQIELLINENNKSYSWIEANNPMAQEAIVKDIKTGLAIKRMLDDFRNGIV